MAKSAWEKMADEAFCEVLLVPPLGPDFEGQQISIAQRRLYFREYNGASPRRSLGKPVVGPPDRPFAELQILQRMEDQGWNAGWLYKGEMLSRWEPREQLRFPRWARALVARIEARAGLNASCWDVFAFQPKPLFIHLVRGTSETVSETISEGKLRWRAAALAEGVPPSAFEVWRWFGGALKGRTIVLTDHYLDRLTGWVECHDGHLSYRGWCDDDGKCAMIEHYRDWGARTEADLLWLVFVRNCEGITWCGFEEWDASRGRQLSLDV